MAAGGFPTVSKRSIPHRVERLELPMNQTRSFAEFAEEAKEWQLDAAFVLGSGMGSVAARCPPQARGSFGDIPGMLVTSVAGHSGFLTVAHWVGKRVLLFEGRLHHYEGHAWRSVTQPIHMAHFLGARVTLLTNAAGGIHDHLDPG